MAIPWELLAMGMLELHPRLTELKVWSWANDLSFFFKLKKKNYADRNFERIQGRKIFWLGCVPDRVVVVERPVLHSENHKCQAGHLPSSMQDKCRLDRSKTWRARHTVSSHINPWPEIPEANS